ncbi:hypothetical protein M9458_035539, partial [Cirrhinus mrigala]
IFSLKRIWDLQALQTLPSCLDFAPGLVKAILDPHPNYLPKVAFSTINPVILEAFCPPLFTTQQEKKSRKDFTYCVQYVLFRFTSTAQASG